jgi:hypothetical protein
MNILKTAQRFVDGVRNRKQTQSYDLAFVKDKGVWYIDMPWDGDRGNLAMVAGADTLLDEVDQHSLSVCQQGQKRRNYVRVKVTKSAQPLDLPGQISIKRTDWTLLGGAHYDVSNPNVRTPRLWLCPVTLTVMGEYPPFIYIDTTPDEA